MELNNIVYNLNYNFNSILLGQFCNFIIIYVYYLITIIAIIAYNFNIKKPKLIYIKFNKIK